MDGEVEYSGSGLFTGFIAVLTILIPVILKKYLSDFRERESQKSPKIFAFHTLLLKLGDHVTLKVIGGNDTSILSGRLSSFLSKVTDAKVSVTENEMFLHINDHLLTLRIAHDFKDNVHIYTVKWEHYGYIFSNGILEDSFDLLDNHWYGAGHVFHHTWPMEKWNTGIGPFVTGEQSSPFSQTYYGGIQERMWFVSCGIGIYVDEDVPLHVSVNNNDDHTLKLRSHFKSPFQNIHNRKTFLNYIIFHADGIRDVVAYMHSTLISNPVDLPRREAFVYPIWSTWAEYKKDVNQSTVLQFARDIKYYDFKCSHVEIDDDWTPHYGQMEFDKKKFPDPKSMVSDLKEMGYGISLWIHPYVSLYAKQFLEYCKKGFFVKGILRLPSIFSWWNGYAGLIDFTNKEATDTFLCNLEVLKRQYGIDSFKIDAGEVHSFTAWTRLSQPLSSPSMYSKRFAQVSAESDAEYRVQEMRVAYQNQSLPMFFRLQDKDSNWSYCNGIKSVIPHVLTQGLLGYPFVLPDMIGGNAYMGLPDRELYIRWVQLNALMPTMQFSLLPWKYDPEVIVIARRMCELHEEYSEKILSLAEEAIETGRPICRPVWWIAPRDEVALTIDSEFLLGDDILVAPVLEYGVRCRDIYLPNGIWIDGVSKEIYDGGKWYKSFPTGLVDLPHFLRKA